MFGGKKPDYSMALKEKSITLHKETVTNIRKVLQLKQSRPRSILHSKDYLIKVIVSSDGSTEGSSVVAHLVSTNESGGNHSQIVRAANKSSGASVPGNELAGTYMGALLIKKLISHLSLIMPKEELKNVKFYMCMDSKSTAMQLLGYPTKKQHARLKDKVKREMHAAHLTLTKAQEQNNARINLCREPGPLLPADINSKSIIGEFTSNKL